jgi:probable HAF family extracellular repeat protein
MKMKRLISELIIVCVLTCLTNGGFAWAYYNVIDLGTLGGSSSHAYSIDDSGQIVGTAWISSGNPHACLFDPSGGGANVDIGTLGGSLSDARSINNSQIVGMAYDTSDHPRACLFRSSRTEINLDLGTLGGNDSWADSINDSGQIVGTAYNNSGYKRACLFDPTGIGINLDLGTLGGSESWAYSINNRGQIVGGALSTDNPSDPHACLFDSNGSGFNIDLGTLGGNVSVACCINGSGQIVGGADNSDGLGRACIFDPTGGKDNIDLGTLGGSSSLAWSINDRGQIVGTAGGHACLFDPTGGCDNIDLSSLIDPFSGWKLVYAYSINNKGWIVGRGKNPYGSYHAFLLIPESVPARTIYVDANGTGDYPTIQEAIDAAYDGDTVLVADGVYIGDGNRDLDFKGKSITVRSENGPENCIIDCNATESEPHRGFYFHNGERPGSILDGLIITNGYGPKEYWPGVGTIYRGGGIYFDNSSPTIKNCKIIGNRTSDAPGTGDGVGAGICCYKASPTISNSQITDNVAGYAHGGGIYGLDSDASIINCNISGNNASSGCGAYFDGGAPIINRCFISNNHSSAGGRGVLYFESGAAPTITNCLITVNWGLPGGICAWTSGGQATITNCTVVNNYYQFGGGAIYWKGSSALVTNCICRDNHLTGEGREIIGAVTVNYNNIQDDPGTPGIGNIDADPLFLTTDCYYLGLGSPCINAGDPNYIPEPNETDLDGLSRVIGGRVDMGAYEFDSRPVAIAGPNQVAYAFIDGLADVTLDGSASYDDDNDPLDYYWSWTIDSNVYEANGISPTLSLPVGEHQIKLIVNDGIDDSEPDYCTVTVIEPLRAKLWLWPTTINCNSRTKYVTTFVYLPKDIGPGDINDEPLTMYPCYIQSKYQHVYRLGHGRGTRTAVMTVFDKDEICDALGIGWHRVEVAGRLQSGRYFYGTDTIRIVRPHSHKWPFRCFYPH